MTSAEDACTLVTLAGQPVGGHDALAKAYSFGDLYGRIFGMKSTIDAAGRLVIPKEIRRRAGLQPGTALDVTWRDGRVEIEPIRYSPRLVWHGPLLVAVPETEVPPLTAEEVEATREALRQERQGGV